MPDEASLMLEAGADYLEGARLNLRRGARGYRVAFDEARHAVELASKVLLLKKTGDYPRTHRVGRTLVAKGLVPGSVALTDLNRALDHHTRGGYGLFETFNAEEVSALIDLADRRLKAAAAWPQGDFRPPVGRTTWD